LNQLYVKYEELQNKLKKTIDNFEIERHNFYSEKENLNEQLSLMSDLKEKGGNLEDYIKKLKGENESIKNN